MAALTLGPAMNSERVPMVGVHNSTVLVRAQCSQPRLRFWGVFAALGTHRKAAWQAKRFQ